MLFLISGMVRNFGEVAGKVVKTSSLAAGGAIMYETARI